MENIEYNSLVRYINEEIIGEAIYSNSTIINGYFGSGGTSFSPVAQVDKNKNMVLNVISGIFGLSEKAIKENRIDKINFQTPFIAFGVAAVSILIYVINVKAEFSFQSIVPCAGLLGVAFILKGTDYNLTEISKYILSIGSNISDSSKVINSFVEISKKFATNLPRELQGGTSGIINSITSPIYEFAKFMYWFIGEMMSRPIIMSMINSIRSYFSSNGREALAKEPKFLDELNAAFYSALEKSKSNTKPDHKILSNFRFNEKTGDIEYYGKTTFKKIITKISSRIQMETLPNGKITYLIDSNEIIGKSMIEGKPINLALVIAYAQAKIPNKPSLPKPTYSFSLESDGSVRLFENGKEISTIDRINKEPNPTYIQEVCQNLFGVKNGLVDSTCSSYFYSAIGKSVEGILKTFGGASHDIYGQIVSANLGVLYDLLKRLGWTTKFNLRMEYELVTIDEWESTAGKQFVEYLKFNPKVRNLLIRIVERLNSDPTFLNLRYNYEYSQKQRKRGHVAPKTLTLSKMVTLGETLALNLRASKNLQTGQTGGFKLSHPLETKYFEMVSTLKSYNQKLNSGADEKIREKIRKIILLETELEEINTKIMSYVKMLKTNREAILDGKILTLDEIETLLSSQKSMTKTHNKRMLSLSTAFGKLQLLIDTVPLIQSKHQSIYHSI